MTMVSKNRSGFYQALISASLTAGRAYYVRVRGLNKAELWREADSKTFTVRLQHSKAAPPCTTMKRVLPFKVFVVSLLL